MEQEAQGSPRDFYITSERAIRQREQLLLLIRWLAFAALLAMVWQLNVQSLSGLVLKWATFFICATFLYEFEGRELLEDFSRREVNVTPAAIELRQNLFTRFITFEELQQMRAIQDGDERILAIELRTDKGAVVLSGYEGMERMFTSLTQRKPRNVVVELEESRMNWNNPLAGFLMLSPLVVLALLPSVFVEVSVRSWWIAVAVLSTLAGLLFLAVRPFSRGRSVASLRREITVGLVFLLLGILIFFR